MTQVDFPRVLLVDDSDIVLERAIAILAPECRIVGAVKDGLAVLEAVRMLRPDVIVLDISMPNVSGLEVLRRLRRAGWTTPIVFLTVDDDEGIVRATQEAGGIGFVVKNRLLSDLPVAISEASAGRRYVSPMR